MVKDKKKGMRGSHKVHRRQPKGLFQPLSSVRGWHRDLGWMVLLYALILFLYRDVAFLNKIFTATSGDYFSQTVVFTKYGFSQFGGGRYPLWYPHIFSGMPFFASMSFDQLIYPVRMVLYYLYQFGFHFLHWNITHFFLGGLFTYLLMRSYRLNRPSAFVSAAIFVFIPMIASMDHANRIITTMYIPVVFYLIRRLYHRRDLASLAWAGLAIGFQMMANHPQIAYYTWLFLGLYFLGRAIAYLRERAGFREPLREGGLLLGSLLVGLGVAAFLLLSVYEYAPYSARGSGDPVAAYNFATTWSLHPKEMLTFLIPSFMGFGGQTYWGYMPFTHCPNYLGVVALFLVALALIFGRNKTTTFFALVGCLATLASFGRFFPVLYKPMYALLPFFNKFRAPDMILRLLNFSVAVLAGFGAQALMEMGSDSASEKRAGKQVRLRKFLLRLAVGLVLVGIFLTLAQGPISRSLMAAYDRVDAALGRHQQISPALRHQLDERRFAMAFGDAWKMLLFLAAASLLTGLYLGNRVSRRLFVGLLTALLLVDFLWLDLGLVRFRQERGYERVYYRSRENQIVRFLEKDPDLFRILPLDEPGTNEYGYFDISSVGGYHPAKLGIYQEAMQKVGLGNPNLMDLLNVKYVITKRSIEHPRFERVLETSGGDIYRNKEVMPRAFTVNRIEVIEEDEEILARLGSEEFDPRKVAILRQEPPFSLEPGEAGTARVIDYGSEEIQLEASAPASCLLVLSEIFYPAGWKAYLDGQETKIYRADHLLRAVYLPAGNHRISFLFRPWTFRAGLWISVLFLLGILVTLFLARLRGHRGRGA
jgi:hypothetical protein